MTEIKHRLDDAFVETMRRNFQKSDRAKLMERINLMQVPCSSTATKEEIINILIREMRRGNYGRTNQTIEQNIKKQIEQKKKHQKFLKKMQVNKVIPSVSSIVIMYFIFLFFSICYFFSSQTKRQGFCDNGVFSKKCFPCPKNANCSNEKAVCETPYDLFGRYCLFNDSYAEKIAILVETSLKYLAKKAGNSQCGYTKRDYLTIDELDTLLYGENLIPSNEFGEIFPKAINILEEDYFVSVKTMDQMKIFISIEEEKPKSCVMKNFLLTSTLIYFFLVIFSILTKGMLFIIIDHKKKKKEALFQAGKVYKEMQGFSTEIDSATLRNHFKNNPEINPKLWPEIELHLQKTPFVIHNRKNGVNSYRFLSV